MSKGILGGVFGGNKKESSRTEVRDKFFGGKEVKKTTVVQEDDKVQLKEKKMHIRPDGSVSKTEKSVQGDDID